MARQSKDVLIDHDYDGIQELDNDLPSWLMYLFYVTIVFAAGYLLYYHVFGVGPTSAEEYQQAMGMKAPVEMATKERGGIGYQSLWKTQAVDVTPKLEAQFKDYIGEDVSFENLIAEAMMRGNEEGVEKLKAQFPDIWDRLTAGIPVVPKVEEPEETLDFADVEPLTDSANLAAGEDIFIKNCVVCHGKNGEGLIGPNVTDNYWIHGGRYQDIIRTINLGVPAKGMIAWNRTLTQEQIDQVGSYMLTLQGTDPPNAKAPQGVLYKAENEDDAQGESDN